LQLLRDRTWFDIPIVYTNQHRAILAIEKGEEGQRVFEAALDAWQKLGDNP
jgi:outer membrane PBP1 activator LpoA protein